MKHTSLAALLMAASIANAGQCIVVADTAVEAADAAQRGQPVAELLARIQVESVDAQITLRRFVITAYEMGKTMPLQDVWDKVFALCNASEKGERPA